MDKLKVYLDNTFFFSESVKFTGLSPLLSILLI